VAEDWAFTRARRAVPRQISREPHDPFLLWQAACVFHRLKSWGSLRAEAAASRASRRQPGPGVGPDPTLPRGRAFGRSVQNR
jgi:hypothetical protein